MENLKKVDKNCLCDIRGYGVGYWSFLSVLILIIFSILPLGSVVQAQVKASDSQGQEKKKDEAETLSEVVVTGFRNIDKRKFSGAMAQVKGSDVKQEGFTDVSRMLEGRVAGLSIQQVSGTFGAAPKVRIRGATSLTGDNRPLWVVDGVILEDPVNISNDQLSSGDPSTLIGSSIAGLNANDIKDITVLKDAAATSLYGARAMNGVVVVTTKAGRVGPLSVSYTVNLSTNFKPSYNNFNLMDSRSQVNFYRELENKGWLNYTDISLRANAGVYGLMADGINTYNPETGRYLVENTPESKAAFLERFAKANTDWFDVLFKNQLIQEHSLSVSGGTSKSQTYFSLSFYRDAGWTVADNVSRYTLNFRNNYKFNKYLSAWINVVGSYRSQRAAGSTDARPNSATGTIDRDFDINPFSYALNTARAMTVYDEQGDLQYFRRNFAPFNILNEYQNNYIDISVPDIKIQTSFTVNILNFQHTKLRLETLGMLRYLSTKRVHTIKDASNQVLSYRANQTSTIRKGNRFLYVDPLTPDADPAVVLPSGGFLNTNNTELLNWDVRNTLVLEQDLTKNGDNTLTTMLGWNIRAVDRTLSNNTGVGYQFDKGGSVVTDYRYIKQSVELGFPYFGASETYDRFVAFFLTTAYSYKSLYNLGVNVRVDGSNKLGRSLTARWLPTWSVEGSWNVDQERFMRSLRRYLNLLKLRASYGLTASLGSATNAAAVYRSAVASRPYTDEQETITNISALENKNLTWEKLHTFDIGVDGGLWNNRVTFSFDYYWRKSFDLIDRILTSGIGGEIEKSANFADMNSRGMELTLGVTPVKLRSGFEWRTMLTMGYNITKITRAENLPLIFQLVRPEGFYKKGFPVRALFSIKNAGIDPVTGVPFFINDKGEVSHRVDLQSNKTDYLKYEGPVDPIVTGGWNNTFSWKGLSLNVFITAQFGNKIRLNPAFKSEFTDRESVSKDQFQRFALPGDATKTPSIPDAAEFRKLRIDGAYPYNYYNFSEDRVVDGSFARLRSVSLSYSFPEYLLSKIKMKGLSLMVTAYNLVLLYADKRLQGQDPEFFNSGGVALPLQRQITATIRCNF